LEQLLSNCRKIGKAQADVLVAYRRRPPNATVQILATQTWRVAMRGVVVPYAVLAAVLVLNAAVAQNDPGQPSSPSSPSAQTTQQADENIEEAVWQAPIGHRQPSAKDVPSSAEKNLGVRSPEDVTIDRDLRICRGC
jgi:hypothetical protein